MENSHDLNATVRDYWEQEVCGTSPFMIGSVEPGSAEWFERVEEYRYRVEPFIHSIAQFTRHKGKKILEIGVGAGTDHLQWARAGCECFGVDLTDAAIETTRRHLSLYGLTSNLQRIDAQKLPFEDEVFDLVYSWGVIHHSEHPEKIIKEIKRILKPGGIFIGMMYGRYSLVAFKLWVRYAFFTGRPWRSLTDCLYHHMESAGTKAYTIKELRVMFEGFSSFKADKFITPYDTQRFPKCLSSFFPDWLGWFIVINAVK